MLHWAAEVVKFPHIRRLSHTEHIVQSLPDLLSVLTFKGTVKVHGANIGVIQERPNGPILVQSRNLLMVQKHSCGSAAFVATRDADFVSTDAASTTAAAAGPVPLLGQIAGGGV